jgi:hypothetical protein
MTYLDSNRSQASPAARAKWMMMIAKNRTTARTGGLAQGPIRIRIDLTMDIQAGVRERHAAPLWAGLARIARAVGAAVLPLAGELRRLNRMGAGAVSRRERVRIVKQTLAGRGKGPNRCC